VKTRTSYYAAPGLDPKAPEDVVRSILRKYKVPMYEIVGPKRSAHLVFVRHLVIYILRKRCRLKLDAIGSMFKRDRSTVLSAIESIENYIFTNHARKPEIMSLLDNFC
jgi:chromosomal replication initiation ATPase DnaA